MKKWILPIVLFVIIIIMLVLLFALPNKTHAPTLPTSTASSTTASISDLIVVSSPLIGGTVVSPLVISGRARGTWYFEASAPVLLKDAGGNTIATGAVTAQGDWMTTDFVPFTASLTFPTQPAGSQGTLVLKNDNPSGDPSRDKTLEIPVTF